jgi:hypothetical protein
VYFPHFGKSEEHEESGLKNEWQHLNHNISDIPKWQAHKGKLISLRDDNCSGGKSLPFLSFGKL